MLRMTDQDHLRRVSKPGVFLVILPCSCTKVFYMINSGILKPMLFQSNVILYHCRETDNPY